MSCSAIGACAGGGYSTDGGYLVAATLNNIFVGEWEGGASAHGGLPQSLANNGMPDETGHRSYSKPKSSF